MALCLALLVTGAGDAWSPSVAGCERTGTDVSNREAAVRLAELCTRVSLRGGSLEAGLRAADSFIQLDLNQEARQALTPFSETGDVRVLYRLCYIDGELGDKRLSLLECQRALAGARTMPDLRLRANAANLLAQLATQDSRYEDAAQVLDELLRSTAGQLSLEFERDARLNLARALRAMGDAPAAERELERLKSLLAGAPLTALELLLEGGLQADLGYLHSAAELFDRSREAARREGQRLFEAHALLRRLDIAAEERDWTRVKSLSDELEPFKGGLQIDELNQLDVAQGSAAREAGQLGASREKLERAAKSSLQRTETWKIDHELGLTLKRMGLLAEARAAFERSVAAIQAQRSELADPSLLPALMRAHREPYQALFELEASTGDDAAAMATLQQLLFAGLNDQVASAAGKAGDAVNDALQRRSAMQDFRRISTVPATEEAVRPASSGVPFVAFVAGDTQLFRVIGSGREAEIERLELAPRDFCAVAQRLGEDFDDDAAASQLGEALFPRSVLARVGRRFAVILPACASNVPLSALLVGGTRLMELAVVSVAPDIASTHPPAPPTSEIRTTSVVLADPNGDLAFAREEAEWLGPRVNAVPSIGPAATTDALGGSALRLLHLATHTEVTVKGPSLVLADRPLSVADILRRRLRADLVVLASCHSGSKLSSTVAETLSTAFLRAGSRATLATLKSVDDEYASRVVRDFYRAGGIDDPAGALTQVQRTLARKDPPSRWAAFLVTGTPEPLSVSARLAKSR